MDSQTVIKWKQLEYPSCKSEDPVMVLFWDFVTEYVELPHFQILLEKFCPAFSSSLVSIKNISRTVEWQRKKWGHI